MLHKAENIISQYVKRGDKIAIAVSGGADSIALAHFVLTRSEIEKSDVMIVHVNHKIRGKNADSDSAFVAQFCCDYSAKFMSFEADVPSIAAITGCNIEQTAREARLGVFSGLVKDGAVKYVLTAHHEQDNTETVLLNLLRGSGLAGLAGMQVLSHGYLLRPFLTTPKSEIDEYMRMQKLEFVTDETNFDSAYSRNFLRNKILPQMRLRWNGLDERILNLSREAKQAVGYLDSVIDESLIKTQADGESVLICEEAFSKTDVLFGRIAICALKQIGKERDIERKHIESIANLQNLESGSEINLANGLYAVKRYDGVMLTTIPPQKVSKSTAAFVLGSTQLDGTRISVLRTNVPENIGSCKTEGGVLVCDMDKIPENAVWRFRREGDVFAPFGSGTKKLKEFLIDKKIPRRDRGTIPILAVDATVLAILGVEISELIKVDNNSKNTLIIKKQEIYK